MDKFLDLLNNVKKKNNSTFTSCEPELIELMRQIDDMIDLKNKAWKADTEALEEQLASVVSANEILSNENGNLKSSLSDEKKSHSFTLSQYEKDVKQLKDDMCRLKHKYIDLQKKIEHTKRKNLQQSKDSEEGQGICKHNQSKKCPAESIAKNKVNIENSADLVKENLILKLKLESVMIENSNLRCMLREQSEPLHIRKRNSIKSTEYSSSDDNSTISSHIFDLSNIQSKNLYQENQSHFSNGSYQKHHSSATSSGILNYFDDDQSLEDKLNDIISQFETVSSSMVAM